MEMVDIDKLELCTNINCDRGKVVTDEVTDEGRFVLKDCDVCNGRGFKLKEE
jgi:hypothetical protein